uniref:Uncharacterized protein n=1 Tax=Phytophthora ramorum TaxID=164328 RepID=H3GR19_PHYRM
MAALRELLLAAERTRQPLDDAFLIFSRSLLLCEPADGHAAASEAEAAAARAQFLALHPHGELLLRLWPEQHGAGSRWERRESFSTFLHAVTHLLQEQQGRDAAQAEAFALRVVREKSPQLEKLLSWSDKPLIEFRALQLLATLAKVSGVAARELVRLFNFQCPAFVKLATRRWKKPEEGPDGEIKHAPFQLRAAYADLVLALTACADKSVHRFAMKEAGVTASLFKSVDGDSVEMLREIFDRLGEIVLHNEDVELKSKRVVFNGTCVHQLLALLQVEDDDSVRDTALGVLNALFFEDSALYVVPQKQALRLFLSKSTASSAHGDGEAITSDQAYAVKVIRNAMVTIGVNELLRSAQAQTLVMRFLATYPGLLSEYLAALAVQLEPKPVYRWFCVASLVQKLLSCSLDAVVTGIPSIKNGEALSSWCSAQSLASRLIAPGNYRKELSRSIQHSNNLVIYSSLGVIEATLKRYVRLASSLESLALASDVQSELRFLVPSPEALVSLLLKLCASQERSIALIYVRALTVFRLYLECLPQTMREVKVDFTKTLAWRYLDSPTADDAEDSLPAPMQSLIVGEMLRFLLAVDTPRLRFLFTSGSSGNRSKLHQMLLLYVSTPSRTVQELAGQVLQRTLLASDIFGQETLNGRADEEVTFWLESMRQSGGKICAEFTEQITRAVMADPLLIATPKKKVRAASTKWHRFSDPNALTAALVTMAPADFASSWDHIISNCADVDDLFDPVLHYLSARGDVDILSLLKSASSPVTKNKQQNKLAATASATEAFSKMVPAHVILQHFLFSITNKGIKEQNAAMAALISLVKRRVNDHEVVAADAARMCEQLLFFFSSNHPEFSDDRPAQLCELLLLLLTLVIVSGEDGPVSGVLARTFFKLRTVISSTSNVALWRQLSAVEIVALRVYSGNQPEADLTALCDFSGMFQRAGVPLVAVLASRIPPRARIPVLDSLLQEFSTATINSPHVVLVERVLESLGAHAQYISFSEYKRAKLLTRKLWQLLNSQSSQRQLSFFTTGFTVLGHLGGIDASTAMAAIESALAPLVMRSACESSSSIDGESCSEVLRAIVTAIRTGNDAAAFPVKLQDYLMERLRREKDERVQCKLVGAVYNVFAIIATPALRKFAGKLALNCYERVLLGSQKSYTSELGLLRGLVALKTAQSDQNKFDAIVLMVECAVGSLKRQNQEKQVSALKTALPLFAETREVIRNGAQPAFEAFVSLTAALLRLAGNDASAVDYDFDAHFDVIVEHPCFVQSLQNTTNNSVRLLIARVVARLARITGKYTRSLLQTLLSSYSMSLSPFDRSLRLLFEDFEAQSSKQEELTLVSMGFRFGASSTLSPSATATSASSKRSHTDLVDDSAWVLGGGLEQNRVRATIERFPLERELSAASDASLLDLDEELPGDESNDDAEQALSGDDEKEAEAYDPAFLLPMLSYFISSSDLPDGGIVQQGLLGIAIRATSSNTESIREYAFGILAHLHESLQATNETTSDFKAGRQVHLLLDIFRRGVEEPLEQVPSVVTVFLNDALAVLTRPTHVLYPQVNHFLLARPAMDLSDVPMFYSLFNSRAALTYRQERSWLLHTLRRGVRSDDDVALLVRRHVLPMLLSFFTSELADTHTQPLITSILLAALRTPSGGVYLVTKGALLEWLAAQFLKHGAASSFVKSRNDKSSGSMRVASSALLLPLMALLEQTMRDDVWNELDDIQQHSTALQAANTFASLQSAIAGRSSSRSNQAVLTKAAVVAELIVRRAGSVCSLQLLQKALEVVQQPTSLPDELVSDANLDDNVSTQALDCAEMVANNLSRWLLQQRHHEAQKLRFPDWAILLRQVASILVSSNTGALSQQRRARLALEQLKIVLDQLPTLKQLVLASDKQSGSSAYASALL